MNSYELTEWNGPKGEEYAVFELDENGQRTSDDPVSTGTLESETAFLERMNATETFIEEARDLGRGHGRDAGTWAADGNSSQEHIRRVLDMLEAGDPQADDFLPRRPDLSGEFADDPTPGSITLDIVDLNQIGDISYGEMAEMTDALADAYEEGVAETFEDSCVETLRGFLAD